MKTTAIILIFITQLTTIGHSLEQNTIAADLENEPIENASPIKQKKSKNTNNSTILEWLKKQFFFWKKNNSSQVKIIPTNQNFENSNNLTNKSFNNPQILSSKTAELSITTRSNNTIELNTPNTDNPTTQCYKTIEEKLATNIITIKTEQDMLKLKNRPSCNKRMIKKIKLFPESVALFMQEIEENHADWHNLESLDFSYCELKQVPWLARIRELKILNLSHNEALGKFFLEKNTTILEELLPDNIVEIDISFCNLSKLPRLSTNRFPHLKTVVYGNLKKVFYTPSAY